MEARYFDDFVHHVLRCEELGVVEGTIACFKGKVMVVFAGEAFLVKIFAYEELAGEEESEDVDDVAQRRDQLIGSVIMEAFYGFGLLCGAMVAQRAFDQFSAVARVGVGWIENTPDDFRFSRLTEIFVEYRGDPAFGHQDQQVACALIVEVIDFVGHFLQMPLQMRKSVLLRVVRNGLINGVRGNKGFGAVNLLVAAELVKQKLGVLLRALYEQYFFVILEEGFQRRDVRIGIDLQDIACGYQQPEHFVELFSGAKDDERAEMLRNEIVGEEGLDLLNVVLQRGFLRFRKRLDEISVLVQRVSLHGME